MPKMIDTARLRLRYNVKELRFDRKWSQQKLADRLGIGRQQVNYIESGRCFPLDETIDSLVRVFEVDFQRLFRKVTFPQMQELDSRRMTRKKAS